MSNKDTSSINSDWISDKWLNLYLIILKDPEEAISLLMQDSLFLEALLFHYCRTSQNSETQISSTKQDEGMKSEKDTFLKTEHTIK